MNGRRRLFSALALLLLTCIPTIARGQAEAPEQDAPGIVGSWISPQVSQAGILMVLQFAPTDDVRASMRARNTVPYQLLSSEGSTFRLGIASGDDTIEQTVEVDGDRILLHQRDQEKARELTRIAGGPSGDYSFIGRWTAEQPQSHEVMVIEYSPDGKMLFDLPVRTIYGTYALDGQAVTIDWTTNTQKETVQLRWSGDELFGTDEAGEEHLAFRRIPTAEGSATAEEPAGDTEPSN